MDYPFGKAAFWILILALLSGIGVAALNRSHRVHRPDLVFLTYTSDHANVYAPLIHKFERDHHVTVDLEVVDLAALQERLTAAFQVHAEVPDLVELGVVLMGSATKGPLEDVGFWDLTDKIHTAHLDDQLVSARFAGFSSRGHIFALPHDVHPVMLLYRADLLAKLHIDPSQLTTWDDFTRIGRQVTKDIDGDGIIDRYMINLPDDSHDGLQMLLLQKGISLFDPMGNVSFDTPDAAETLCWYVRQTEGATRISFNAQGQQNLCRCMIDGLCLFYICPDWRSRQFQLDVPSLSGKLALMPLPAWSPGQRRTSTWGATGLAITKACQHKDLAWQLAMSLYYDKNQLGPRFEATNILPPLKAAWTNPAYDQPRTFFSNQPIGRLYANLAPFVPSDYANPYTSIAQAKLRDAYLNTKLYYRDHPNADLMPIALDQLHSAAASIRQIQSRNVLLETAH
ncbi:MAG TPA: extracellular solute-binding protein [Tepidisphaeraceae bacterium]|jgi:arabinosaccharide transport system substrate-binding protein|nr:extracellular solute-binding protein [Tepidisphaeraceae bacterium]